MFIWKKTHDRIIAEADRDWAYLIELSKKEIARLKAEIAKIKKKKAK